MTDLPPDLHPGPRPTRPAGAWRATLALALVLAAVVLSNAGAPPATPAPAAAPPGADGFLDVLGALEAMGNRATHDKQWEAARWLAARLAALGLDARIDAYEHEGRSWPNVSATVAGASRRDELVLVVAHLDSVCLARPADAPGADDDGSGVAVLVDVARRIAARPLARTVRFVVFSNEEQGRAGSRAFAREARAAGVAIRAVLNVDTVGYGAPASLVDVAGLRAIGSARGALGALKRMVVNGAK